MNTTQSYQKEDLIINFRDMFLHILLRWRSIVAGVLIFTLLAGGYKYWKDYSFYQAVIKEDNAVAELDENSLLKVTALYNQVRNAYASASYNQNALLMQIDPAKKASATVNYLVTGSRSYATATLYANMLKDQALEDLLCAALDVDKATSYVLELITPIIDNGAEQTEVADHVLLNLQITAPTEAMCRTISQQIKNYITEKQETVSQVMGQPQSITLVGETYAETNDSALRTSQQIANNELSNMQGNISVAMDALSNEERVYLYRQLQSFDEDFEVTKPSVSKKFLVLGFGGGLVLFVFLYAITYVFDRHIKSRQDLAERYGLYLFGSFGTPYHAKGRMNQWLVQQFHKKENAVSPAVAEALMQQQLVQAVRQAQTQEVYITGSAVTDSDQATLDGLCAALREKGISARHGACPVSDAEALEQLTHSNATVVLAEKLGVSQYDDIYNEIDLCSQLGRPVLGMILL